MADVLLHDHPTRVQTKFDIQLLSALDAYRREQRDPPSRAEAIRQLCAKALNETPAVDCGGSPDRPTVRLPIVGSLADGHASTTGAAGCVPEPQG
jgi:hypothetical protein